MKGLLTALILISLQAFSVCTFTISTTRLDTGYTKHPYQFQLLNTCSFGTVVYTVISGKVPNGLQLQSNGSLAGIVSLNGDTTITFTVLAIDGNGATATRAYTFVNRNTILPYNSVLFLQSVTQTTTRSNQSPPPYWDMWDVWNNVYSRPAVTAGNGVSITSNNNSLVSYTISASGGGSNITSLVGIGSTTVTGSAHSYTVSTPAITYKEYDAIIRASAGSYTVTVLQNNIGSISVANVSTGETQFQLSSAFTINKTFITCSGSKLVVDTTDPILLNSYYVSANAIEISSSLSSGTGTFLGTDSWRGFIQIRVYN